MEKNTLDYQTITYILKRLDQKRKDPVRTIKIDNKYCLISKFYIISQGFFKDKKYLENVYNEGEIEDYYVLEAETTFKFEKLQDIELDYKKFLSKGFNVFHKGHELFAYVVRHKGLLRLLKKHKYGSHAEIVKINNTMLLKIDDFYIMLDFYIRSNEVISDFEL